VQGCVIPLLVKGIRGLLRTERNTPLNPLLIEGKGTTPVTPPLLRGNLKKGGKMARILIVDDAAFMRGSLKFIIEASGHEVVGMAKNGREAVEMYKQLNPDIVTLDILMKEMDGLKALKDIKSLNPNAKIVMVTALGQEEKQEEAMKLGACGYLRKPFKQTDIIEVIQRVINEG